MRRFVLFILLFVAVAISCAAVFAWVQTRGVRVTVVSTMESRPPTVADELRRQADVFIDLMELRPKIIREERSQGPRVTASAKRVS